MHGLGNDFVIFDTREQRLELSQQQACAIANRHTGIGCDQLILIEKPRDDEADAFMRIYNTDGREAEACGNATRCVASILMGESGKDQTIIETLAGLLDAHNAEGDLMVITQRIIKGFPQYRNPGLI